MLEFLQKNFLLVAAAVGSGTLLIWPMLRGAGGASINTLQATQLMNRENALVLDVRDADAYGAGHILGARNVPLAQLDKRAEELAKFKAKPVIVVCELGNTSVRAVRLLKAKGFANVLNLTGGFRAWLQGGLPVEK